MNKEQKFLIESIVENLVTYVMRDFNVGIIDGFSMVYFSLVYEKLTNLDTEFYTQSPLYVYRYLKDELRDPSTIS